MPKFFYTVKDDQGKTYENMVEAESRDSLIRQLQEQKYFIVNLKNVNDQKPAKQASAPAVSKKKKFSHSKVKINDKLIFARQMATLLKAGVNLTRSLAVVLQQTQSEKMHLVLSQVSRDVEQGASLSLALSRHSSTFDQFWVSLAEVGEASGTIPETLEKLAEHVEREVEFRSAIVSAFIYPLILFTVAAGAVIFFALVVGPKFESIFDSMNADLPLITEVLLSIFSFVRSNMLLLLGVTAVGIFFFIRYLKTEAGQITMEQVFFRLPKIGEIYRMILVERFCSQMGILIDSGVPILYALDITKKLVNNHACGKVVVQIKDGIKNGQTLAAPMQKSQFFPLMAVQMIVVGEETGQLSQMLNYVAKYYESLVTTFMKRFSTIVEPLMIVFMGVVIGIIVVAMFLPLFNIAQMGG